MKRILLVAFLAACSGQGVSPAPVTAQAPLAAQNSRVSPDFPCHAHPRFVKKFKLEKQGGTVVLRTGQRGYAFTGMTVWNHLQKTTVLAYPTDLGASGGETLTLPPRHADQEYITPPSDKITVVMEGSSDPGTGVEVSATSCFQ